ncbi:MAG: hypothetical protein RR490_03000, partial [Niameybacter sp.]
SVELNVTQRCAAHVGSKRDIDESIQIGKAGVQAALDGDTATMMCYNRISDIPYKMEIVSHAIDGIANKEKVIPRAWINEAGNDVTEELKVKLLLDTPTAFLFTVILHIFIANISLNT